MTRLELREDWEVAFGPHRFPYKDLHRATEGFKNKNLLGAGGFGRVYKGVFPVSCLEIAVKQVLHNSSQGVKEFVTEVVSLGRLQHRNLVRLLGYCRIKGQLLLVYDYMSNGSLDKYLYGEGNTTLSWSQRFKIIKDIAAALLYLHEECEEAVIHRDIKASNVLLNSEMDGQLGDFSLARLYDHGADPESTHDVRTNITEAAGNFRPSCLHRAVRAEVVIGNMLFLVRLLLIMSLGLNLEASIAASDIVDQFVYSGFSGSNLTMDGTTTITSDGFLQLSNGTAYLKGHGFHPSPLRLCESSNGTVRSFSVAFVFGIVSSYADFSAHSMAFFIAPNTNFSTALPTNYLGLTNVQNNGNASNRLFAVELDTIQSVEFKDINANHVGININGLESLRSYNAGYYDDKSGVFQSLKLISRQAMQVWVDYNGETKQINVTLAPFRMTRPLRTLLSTVYDLSTVLTDVVYLEFSTATGHVNSLHCVLGWSFGINSQAPAIDISKLPNLPRIGPRPRSKDWEVEFGPHRFSYKDLYYATGGFKERRLLGEGGFGKVYKGVLRTSKLEVVVKRVSHQSKQGMKEFLAEIAIIGRIRHRNLVQLLGYCRRKDELLFVYAYMPNGSLDKYLYDSDLCTGTLTWLQRFHVLKGVATGLLYLHEGWEKVVIHRDIKASNVLLDKDMNGQLGHFGLASPRACAHKQIVPLTDVFIFDFLLELTCGQKPIKENVQGSGHTVLADWVLQHWRNGSLMATVDRRLQGDYNVEVAGLVLKLGLMCSHPFPNARPDMGQVVSYLDGVVPLPELTPTDLSFDVPAMMQKKEFGMSAESYPDLVTSFGTISSISGGR
ncbi:hypothetical protein PR202_gb17149 [Eleusine coracana subsp. coracana]|uniref:non-specific serine/threonine protein kinase n=1 Tax=Eleusine coracana subsp. coracana TaxID=191504 RepID=A0AAV5F273_ELECO|nr:hypothetical protein PR202_gb17149 [Eleusine coracana subsp. coracana]